MTFGEGPARNAWDQDIIDVICPPDRFESFEHWNRPIACGGAVFVIPGRYNTEDTHLRRIDDTLAGYQWAVVIITSDEESLFPWYRIHHPNLRIWIQSPRPDKHRNPSLRFLPVGCPALTGSVPAPDRGQPVSVFFYGQVNHRQRDEMVAAFTGFPDASITPSPGFTQGLPRDDYITAMSRAKVVACPSGPASADSFRVWEALELGAIPISDDGPLPDSEGRAVTNYPRGFWTQLLGPAQCLVRVRRDWTSAPDVAATLIEDYPHSNNVTFAAYQLFKRELRAKLLLDIQEASRTGVGASELTCVVPTSPTPNNPDFSHIADVIHSIRHYTDAEILIMIDGIHESQSHLRENYEEYVRRILWMSNHFWKNVTPIRFSESLHQSGKLIATLPYIRTPLILWNEHDTPIEGKINWDACLKELREDRLDVIRFYHEANLHPEHMHLMGERLTPLFVATWQQSGRPHLARTDYYRRIMADHFSPESKTFIEHKMHSVCQSLDIHPWTENRMAIYAPEGEGVIKRSGHLDARGDEPTYEETLVP